MVVPGKSAVVPGKKEFRYQIVPVPGKEGVFELKFDPKVEGQKFEFKIDPKLIKPDGSGQFKFEIDPKAFRGAGQELRIDPKDHPRPAALLRGLPKDGGEWKFELKLDPKDFEKLKDFEKFKELKDLKEFKFEFQKQPGELKDFYFSLPAQPAKPDQPATPKTPTVEVKPQPPVAVKATPKTPVTPRTPATPQAAAGKLGEARGRTDRREEDRRGDPRSADAGDRDAAADGDGEATDAGARRGNSASVSCFSVAVGSRVASRAFKKIHGSDFVSGDQFAHELLPLPAEGTESSGRLRAPGVFGTGLRDRGERRLRLDLHRRRLRRRRLMGLRGLGREGAGEVLEFAGLLLELELELLQVLQLLELSRSP